MLTEGLSCEQRFCSMTDILTLEITGSVLVITSQTPVPVTTPDRDAIEFLMAGATAIEIGTANFLDPTVSIKVSDGINDWLDSHGCQSVQEIIGVID